MVSKVTQHDLDMIYKRPALPVELRYAHLLTVLFLSLFYSSSLPLMTGIAALCFIAMFSLDKCLMLRVYVLALICCSCCSIAFAAFVAFVAFVAFAACALGVVAPAPVAVVVAGVDVAAPTILWPFGCLLDEPRLELASTSWPQKVRFVDHVRSLQTAVPTFHFA